MTKKLFIVTRDLDSAQLWDSWLKKYHLSLPPAEVIAQIRDRLDAAVRSALSKHDEHGICIHVEFHGSAADHRFEDWQLSSQHTTLSLDPVTAYPYDFEIRASRKWSIDGMPIHDISEAKQELSGQVESALVHWRTRRVHVIDDGIITGNTIFNLVKLIQHSGVMDVSVRVRLAEKEALLRLRDRLAQSGVNANVSADLTIPQAELHRWICERDILIGFPRSGRTIHSPAATELGITIGIPDLFGWNMFSHAGIRRGKFEFAASMTEVSLMFWRAMETTNGRLSVAQFPSFPALGLLNNEKLLSTGIVDYIENASEFLFGAGGNLPLLHSKTAFSK